MATTIPGTFNATEAAEYLGLTDSLVRRYCREGKITADRIGRNWVMRQKALDQFKRTPRQRGNPNFRSN